MAVDFVAAGIAAALLAAGTPAIVEQTGPRVLVAGPMARQALTYGAEPRQGLELFTRAAAGRAPLIVYLHGGGWSAGSPRAGSGGVQAEHFTSRGFAYATISYRFVPTATVEDQLRDVAAAIAFLRRQNGVDPDRIVLIGHSSGAHLAAMVGSDPAWLEAVGTQFGAVKAVMLLDPAALDIPPIMAMGGGGTVERYYKPAFGDDPARQSALSPMKHVEPPNAPAWLMLHDVNNPLAAMQSGDFAAGLRAAGTNHVAVEPIAQTTHLRLNDEIGRPDDVATGLIDRFLAGALPETQRPRFR
jgi:acetyl esterase/lipase